LVFSLIHSQPENYVYNWNDNLTEESHIYRNANLIIFSVAVASALLLFFVFHPDIVRIGQESPILINIMFAPTFAIGFIYGMKITQKVVNPAEIRSPFKRGFVKILLFFFVIGGLFSSVNFALSGGGLMPDASLLNDGLIQWFSDLITSNGGATFLIVSSITLMGSATKRIVGLGGKINSLFTFVGTFVFFMMIALSLSHSDPTNSEIYLYTFYQSGIIGGSLFQMNRLTSNLNMWEDYKNGFF